MLNDLLGLHHLLGLLTLPLSRARFDPSFAIRVITAPAQNTLSYERSIDRVYYFIDDFPDLLLLVTLRFLPFCTPISALFVGAYLRLADGDGLRVLVIDFILPYR